MKASALCHPRSGVSSRQNNDIQKKTVDTCVEQMSFGLRDSQVPEWLRFHGVTTGYRMGGTYGQALLSLFRIHNECVNAWTMIATSAFSTAALAYVLAYIQPVGVNILPFIIFWFSALVHLPFSVGYHLFMPISPTAYNFWRKLDIAFIFVSSIFLTFSLDFFVFPWWGILINTGSALAVTLAQQLRILSG